MSAAYLKAVFLSFMIFTTSTALAQEYGSVTDQRDGTKYKTVQIGNQVWLAENMKYIADDIACRSDAKHGASVKNYGCLYSWADAQKVCPAGWHLPSKVEFSRLLVHVGEGQEGSENLRDSSWKDGKNGSGFSALPAGAFKADSFASLGSMAYFWTVTKCSKESNNDAYSMTIGPGSVSAKSCNSQGTDFLSVRCIKDAEEENTLNTFIDQRDGNTYKTVKIGQQIWLAENMKYIADGIDFKSTQKPNEYGYLYNFADAKKVCPNGWHLPSRVEFERLLTSVGKGETGSDNLRHRKWDRGKNVSGFGALPAGKCEKKGCSEGEVAAYFWSSTEQNKKNAYGLYVDASKTIVNSGKSASYLSVRCIKEINNEEQEEMPLSNAASQAVAENKVEYDSFTDQRDDNTYKTVKIGKQTWMAENMRYISKNVTCKADTDADSRFISNYGCLYSWDDAKKVCPSGWHLPTKTDFERLLAYVGVGKEGADDLKHSSWAGKDNYGFSALPAGNYSNGGYKYFGSGSGFWSSTESNEIYAYSLIVDSKAGVHEYWKGDGISVRCIKEINNEEQKKAPLSNDASKTATKEPVQSQDNNAASQAVAENKVEYGSFTDQRDGNTYKTVKIGNQTWMAENMRYITDSGIFKDSINCKANTDKDSRFIRNYGCLYSWFDTKKVCPSGWHLPTKTDFEKLLAYVGAGKEGADSLKHSSWAGKDNYGFGALPAGEYSYIGRSYLLFGASASFWSSTKNSNRSCCSYLHLIVDSSVEVRSSHEWDGRSVRCIKD